MIFKDELEKGAWRPTLFFPDNDKIEFTLYPMEKADSNKIVGSELSLKENDYNQLIKDTFYSKYVSWNQILDSLKTLNETGSDYANEISDSINNLMQAVPQFELKYIKKNLNIYGYSKFLKILKKEKDRKLFTVDTLKNYADLLQQKFPDHPYNKISQHRLNGLTNINVGGDYVDFTAKDSTGHEYTISDIIVKNNLTLIDLWAPWCRPCIRKSKKVVPIYKEFKDNGFGVIGVIGGISTLEKFKQTVKKHKYPWLLLAEINYENNLWEKYYISKSGGGQFLVDNKGKILTINPSADDLRNFILEE
ncbi:MAG: redoxin domain-containing protein [Bacteroidales bacterium]|nr:redoxin domain-containing protein [Bacteroidales bacterium]